MDFIGQKVIHIALQIQDLQHIAAKPARGRPRKQTRNHASEWPKRITQQDLASELGFHRSAIGHWRKDGCPANEDGTYSLKAVWDWRIESEIKKVVGKDRDAEETRRIAALADTYEFKLAVMQGEYVKADLVAATWADRVTAARVAVMALGASLAPSLVGLDATAAKKLIDTRARAILEDLAREFEAALQDAEDEKTDDI